jgi:hypothetical protein
MKDNYSSLYFQFKHISFQSNKEKDHDELIKSIQNQTSFQEHEIIFEWLNSQQNELDELHQASYNYATFLKIYSPIINGGENQSFLSTLKTNAKALQDNSPVFRPSIFVVEFIRGANFHLPNFNNFGFYSALITPSSQHECKISFIQTSGDQKNYSLVSSSLYLLHPYETFFLRVLSMTLKKCSFMKTSPSPMLIQQFIK